MKKSMKLAALALTISILSADIFGSSIPISASIQPSQAPAGIQSSQEATGAGEGKLESVQEVAGVREGKLESVQDGQGAKTGEQEAAQEEEIELSQETGEGRLESVQDGQGAKTGEQEPAQEEEPELSQEAGKGTLDSAQDRQGAEAGEQEPVQEAEQGNPGSDEDAVILHQQEAAQAFAGLLEDYAMYAILANGTEFPVYQQPAESAKVLHVLTSGYQVRLDGVAWEGDGRLWFQIAYGFHDVEYTGYIRQESLVSQDFRFGEWMAQYGGQGASRAGMRSAVRAAGNTDLSSFPTSYQASIRKLIEAHPNWTFVPMNTGLDWAEVLENEMVNSRNLVDINHPVTWKSTDAQDYNASTGEWVIKNGTTWVQASEAIVKYYLDPRNFLNEESVFQFELLTYNSAAHTEDGVEKILSNTFMSHKKLEDGSGGGITYAQAFMKIGKELKVSPYFLASRVRQEQGVNGTSALISGKYSGYKGYYNYFNIGATGIGTDVITSGLTIAKNNGWNSRYKSLYGGANVASSSYITKGQDTFYLQKFDVDESYNGLYWHQYMQNLLAADNEGKNVKNSYHSMGAVNNSFVFKVPVYNNMPSSACKKPSDKLSKPSLKASKSGDAAVTLSWKKITGAVGYQIYRAGEDGNYKKLKTLSSNSKVSYQDKTVVPGNVYSYKVRAYVKLNTGNQYSSYSAVKKVDFTIAKPSWKKLSVKNYTTASLSWNPASVSGYKIYRKTDNGKYKSIKTLSGGAVSSYKDTTILPGHTYVYKIRAYKTVNGKKYYAAYTDEKSIKVKMKSSVLNQAAVTGGSKVKLDWKRDSKAGGYYIYRADSAKGKYKKVKNIKSNKTVSWEDSSVASGKTYYYKIRAYVKTSEGTKSSGYSKVMSTSTALGKAKAKSATAVKSGIKVKWKKSSAAKGYKIYRTASKKGTYKMVMKITKNTKVSWTDKNAKPGKTYYYKIKSYSQFQGKTKNSSYSNVVSAKAGTQTA